MKVPLVDLVSQHAEVKGQVEAALLEVARSGQYVLGQKVKAFEREMAELHGVKHAIGVASGTDALKIALEALGLRPGDEVITTPFTFVSTVEVIRQLGGVPVFVDIEPRSFNIDPSLVQGAVTPRTKAILPIHLFGQLAEMEPLQQIAEEHGLSILEDAAQAVAAQRNGKPPGQFGDAAILSFFPTKNLGAMGDGGIILTDDDDVCDLCISLRMHGMPAGDYMYRQTGYASRLDEIQAAVLRVKTSRLAEWNERRRRNAAIYAEVLGGTEVVLPQTLPGNVHTFHQFTIRHPRRDDLRRHLSEEGIGTGVYYPLCLHLQDAYRDLGYKEGDFAEAEQASREVLSLPIHAHLSEEQVRFAAESVAEFCLEAVSAS
jgi:dTDP-4-amino-4,6-dideoxygalactose transaminase